MRDSPPGRSAGGLVSDGPGPGPSPGPGPGTSPGTAQHGGASAASPAGPGEAGSRAAAAEAAQRALPSLSGEGRIAAVQPIPGGGLAVRLDPPELGRLTIALDFDGAQVRAIVTAEQPAAADLVRRHADQLLQQLRNAGFDAATLDLAGPGGGQADPQRRDGAPPGSAAQPAGDGRTDTAAAAARSPDGRAASGRVDIRL
ncbi:MAG: flagellar hook-length control protein FliK [Pseudomonadota bacterium]